MTQSLKERLLATQLSFVKRKDGTPVAPLINPDGPAAVQEIERLEARLREMLCAIENGQIDSPELDGDPENGIPPHRWHEQWAHHAAALLKSQDQNDV